MGKEIIARGQAVVVCQKDGYTINQSVGEYIFTALNNGTIPSAVTIVSTIKVTSGDSTVTNFTIGTINKPTGFASINVNNANKTITYTVAANTTTLADNGTVLIPIIIEGNTYTVSFKWAKSKDGQNGSNGVGIKSIVNKYAVSASNTVAPTSWGTTVPTMTATTRYLWNYEIVTYTNNSVYETEKRVIGVYGDKGETGETGKGVSSVDVLYYLSTSSTTQTGGSWSTTAPTWVNGKYMWSKTKITYTDGSAKETNPVCITGAKGNTGNTGATGAAGKGIKSIVEQYYLSTSNTSQAGGSWTNTPPAWANGKYMWTRSIITYTDNSTTTTTPICVSGSTGATGNGILSITEYYLASASSSGVTTSTSGWTTTVQTTSTSKKYLWNYEVVQYTNGSKYTSTPVIIGTYGATGPTGPAGKPGTDGYTVSASRNSYIVSTDKDGRIHTAVTTNTTISILKGSTPVTPTIGALPTVAGCTLSKSGATVTIVFNVGTSLAENGTISIPVVADGKSFAVSFSYAKARAGAAGADSNMLDWVKDWNNNKTQINENSVITPKIFAGTKNSNGTLTGVAMGKFSLSVLNSSGVVTTETINGIYGFKDGYKTFYVNNTGDAGLGRGNQFIRYNATTGKIEFGSDVSLNWTQPIETINTALGGKGFPKLTYIDGKGIYTGTLTAEQVNAVNINASSIKTGILSADRIAAGSINASKIAAETITSDKIASRTITADKIRAGAITANEIKSGTVTSTQLDANSIKANIINTAYIQGLILNFTKGTIGGWTIDGDSIFRGTKSNTSGTYTSASGAITIGSNGIRGFKWKLDSSGAGALAGGNISWDASGNVTFGSNVSLNWTNAANNALNSAKSYADTKKTEAINSAATTAQQKADAAKNAAISDATNKVNALKPQLTKIDANGIYTGTINASQITAGTINAGRIDVNALKSSLITAGNIEALTLNIGKGKIGGWNISGNAISKNSVSLGSDGSITNGTKWKLNNDGSGQLANGNIKWDAAGTLTFDSNSLPEMKDYKEYTIDATGLNENTYYPVCTTIYTHVTAEISVHWTLNGGVKPSWATHGSGSYSVKVRWTANGSGWGTIAVTREILEASQGWNNGNVVGDIGQLTHASVEYIYVRGGGKYVFRVKNTNGIPVLRSTGYTAEGETVSPKTSVTFPVARLTKIDANGIYTGTLTASQINAANCNFTQGKIGGFTIYDKKISTYNNPTNNHYIEIHNTGYICNSRTSDHKDYWALNADGSASFGLGSTTFRASGGFVMTGDSDSKFNIDISGTNYFRVNDGSMVSIRGDGRVALSVSTYGANNSSKGIYVLCNASGYGYAIESYGNVLLRARNSEKVTINGLHVNARNISSSTTLQSCDDFVSFSNTGGITVYMPTNVNAGKIIYMKKRTSRAQVTLMGQFREHGSANTRTNWTLGEEQSIFFIKDTDNRWVMYFCA